MKKLVTIGLFALMTASAFASIFKDSYKTDTIVPETLQDEVALAVYNRHACLSNLTEFNTEVRNIKIDQGMIDHYYTTVFAAKTNFGHPSTVYVTVESAEYAFQNGKNTEVLSIQTNYGDYVCP